MKLEEALALAVDFHNSLQDFINWLTQAEQTLNVASRPSLILDTVLFQIDEHKVSCNSVCDRRQAVFMAESVNLVVGTLSFVPGNSFNLCDAQRWFPDGSVFRLCLTVPTSSFGERSLPMK